MCYFVAHGCCLTAKPDEIATKAGTENHKKDRQSTAEAGELSASDEQALISLFLGLFNFVQKGEGSLALGNLKRTPTYTYV